MLVGNASLGKKRLAGELRCSGQPIQVVTPHTAESISPEDLTFLLQPDSAHADGVHAQRLSRSDLDRHSIAYQVLYGTGRECLAQALQVIRSKLPDQPAGAEPTQKTGWVWACEKCSDPLCERQLLSSLLASRKAGSIEPLP